MANKRAWSSFREAATVPFLAALGVMVTFRVAEAAFPIAGLDTMVADSGEFMTNQGGLIGVILGIGRAAIAIAGGHGEGGVGHFVKAGCAGGVFGSTPEIASYVV